jgi:hypothetical protein
LDKATGKFHHIAMELKPGTTVGSYRLNKPVVDRNASFETASYWEETTIPAGTYPLKVGLDRNKDIYLYASLEGKVSDNYFPSSFGGHITGVPKKTGIGDNRSVGKRIPIINAIRNTGIIPNKEGGEADIFVDPKFWASLKEIATDSLKRNLEGLDYFRKKTDVSGIKTFANHIASSAETLQAIEQLIQYHSQPSFTKNHIDNWSWATIEPTKSGRKPTTPKVSKGLEPTL